jgi:hypothetical protein
VSSALRDFVLKYLELTGQEFRIEAEDDRILFHSPSDPERVQAITVSGEVASRGECALVAVGSPLLNSILEDTRRRGVAAAQLPAAHPEDVLRRISASAHRAVLGAVEGVPRRAFKLYYLLTLISNRRSQRVVEVDLDSSGEEAPWLYALRGYVNDEAPGGLDPEGLQLVLDKSALTLEKRVAQEVGALREESERLLAEAIDRIRGYYAQLRDETRNEAEFAHSLAKNSLEGVRGPASAGLSFAEAERLMAEYDGLEDLEIERERARNRLRVEVMLIGILQVSYRLLRCHLQLQGEGASREIELNLLPNGEIEPLSCEACGKPMGEIIVCSNGHMVGRECLLGDAPGHRRCAICHGGTEGAIGPSRPSNS